jgi:hypothetical protein
MMRLKYTVKLRTDVGQYTSDDTYIGMENVESQTGLGYDVTYYQGKTSSSPNLTTRNVR